MPLSSHNSMSRSDHNHHRSPNIDREYSIFGHIFFPLKSFASPKSTTNSRSRSSTTCWLHVPSANGTTSEEFHCCVFSCHETLFFQQHVVLEYEMNAGWPCVHWHDTVPPDHLPSSCHRRNPVSSYRVHTLAFTKLQYVSRATNSRRWVTRTKKTVTVWSKVSKRLTRRW